MEKYFHIIISGILLTVGRNLPWKSGALPARKGVGCFHSGRHPWFTQGDDFHSHKVAGPANEFHYMLVRRLRHVLAVYLRNESALVSFDKGTFSAALFMSWALVKLKYSHVIDLNWL
jgi:hypothetical protein